MSQEQTTQVINNDLTNRIQSAYVAKNAALLLSKDGNIVLISGENEDATQTVEMVIYYEDLVNIIGELDPNKKDSEPHEL